MEVDPHRLEFHHCGVNDPLNLERTGEQWCQLLGLHLQREVLGGEPNLLACWLTQSVGQQHAAGMIVLRPRFNSSSR